MKKNTDVKNDFKVFMSKTLSNAVKSINGYMKENGIVFLSESEEDFYHPDAMDTTSFEDGEAYADSQYDDKISIEMLHDIINDEYDEGEPLIDFSHFTTMEKLKQFIDNGFGKLKRTQRLDYIKNQKTMLRNQIDKIENDIFINKKKLSDAKNELEDFLHEENLISDDGEGRNA